MKTYYPVFRAIASWLIFSSMLVQTSTGNAQELTDSFKSQLDSMRLTINEAPNDSTKALALLKYGERLSDFSMDSMRVYSIQAEEIADAALNQPSLLRKDRLRYLTIKAMALNNKGFSYFASGQLSYAVEVYKECLVYLDTVKNSAGLGAVTLNLAVIYQDRGEIDSAVAYNWKAYDIYKAAGNELMMARAMNNNGILIVKQGDVKKALEINHRVLDIYLKADHKPGIASVYNNIGRIYEGQGELDRALINYRKTLAIRTTEDDIRGMSTAYNNIGAIHRAQENLDSALYYFRESLKFRRHVGMSRGVAESYQNIGSVFYTLNELDSAKHYHSMALDSLRAVESKKGITHSLYYLGLIAENQGNLPTAAKYASESLSVAQDLGYPEFIADAAKLYARVSSALGDWKTAYKMQLLNATMQDSLTNDENKKAALKSQFRFEYEVEAIKDSMEFAKQEAVLTEKTKKQQLGLFGAAAGILLVLALAYSIYNGKKKSDELLLNILPSETAEELKQKGHADAKLIDEVTVLFTDFKGFTAMSEQLSPQDLVDDLNVCFSEFDRIMERHGIEKIKTIGDAYMAACGLPSPNAEHAQNVIKAAFEMRDFVAAGKTKKMEQGLPYFEIRIGVHTGPVVAGIVGIKKFQYDIWGDTVNTAARMESSGEAGKVNISESTYELIKEDDDFTFESRGKIAAKGKGDLEMYFVEQKG